MPSVKCADKSIPILLTFRSFCKAFVKTDVPLSHTPRPSPLSSSFFFFWIGEQIELSREDQRVIPSDHTKKFIFGRSFSLFLDASAVISDFFFFLQLHSTTTTSLPRGKLSPFAPWWLLPLVSRSRTSLVVSSTIECAPEKNTPPSGNEKEREKKGGRIQLGLSLMNSSSPGQFGNLNSIHWEPRPHIQLYCNIISLSS